MNSLSLEVKMFFIEKNSLEYLSFYIIFVQLYAFSVQLFLKGKKWKGIYREFQVFFPI